MDKPNYISVGGRPSRGPQNTMSGWRVRPKIYSPASALPNRSPGRHRSRAQTHINIGSVNIHAAWTHDSIVLKLPVAIRPTNIHPRMSVQRSGFTVHGIDKSALIDQVPQLLTRYDIEPKDRIAMKQHLCLLGISHSTLWPDLDGLAKELEDQY
jgi:hypothetical protein